MLFTALVPVVLAALALAAVPFVKPELPDELHPTLFPHKCIDLEDGRSFNGAPVVM